MSIRPNSSQNLFEIKIYKYNYAFYLSSYLFSWIFLCFYWYKLKYEYLNNLNFWLGANIFYGHSDGFYGQFNNRDNVYLGFEWGF